MVVGANNSSNDDPAGVNRAYFAAYFLLQTFSQLSIAFFIGYLLKNAFTSLAAFIGTFLILEPLAGRLLKATGTGIEHFLPFEISNGLIPPPAFWGKVDPASYQVAMAQTRNHLFYTILFTGALWYACFGINRRRDL